MVNLDLKMLIKGMVTIPIWNVIICRLIQGLNVYSFCSAFFDSCVKTTGLEMFAYYRPTLQICKGRTLEACVSDDFCGQPAAPHDSTQKNPVSSPPKLSPGPIVIQPVPSVKEVFLSSLRPKLAVFLCQRFIIQASNLTLP